MKILHTCLIPPVVALGLACHPVQGAPAGPVIPDFARIALKDQPPLVLNQPFTAQGYSSRGPLVTDGDPGPGQVVIFGPAIRSDSFASLVVVLDSANTIGAIWLRYTDAISGPALVARYTTVLGPPTGSACADWRQGAIALTLCPRASGGMRAYISRVDP